MGRHSLTPQRGVHPEIQHPEQSSGKTGCKLKPDVTNGGVEPVVPEVTRALFDVATEEVRLR